mmetsp:Transcript_18475/g.45775  ORF Transcript_18475/g.45775 Transcript_18475/m.45775 type:complete len:753 (+) Transcript_18475:94-2352(+)
MSNKEPERLPCRPNVIRKGTLQDNAESMDNDQAKSGNGININCHGETIIVRKGLGCRRSRKDMLSPEEQKRIKTVGDKQEDYCIRKGLLPPKPTRILRELKPRRRLIFTSPRVITSDEDLFPCNHSLYREPNDRWQQISEQAESHRQDGSVINIGRRPSNANSFRMGMIRCAAVRVRSLNLWVDHEKDTLLDWLEMIAEVFVNLEHLTLTEDAFPGEDDLAVSARMRRLYVLSVMPNLKSIDDMVVTTEEREMSDPKASNDELEIIDGKETNSRILSMPVSVDTDSMRSSRAFGIEVEFLEAKCWEVKQTETETTASISPTSNSEFTITATDSDDHFLFGQEERLLGASYLTDAIGVSPVPATDEPSVNSRADKDRIGTEAYKRIVSAGEMGYNLTHGCNNAPIGSIEDHEKNTSCTTLSRKVDTLSCDNSRSKVTGSKVRAFHSDSNSGIELVPVSSIDIELSGTRDVSTFGQKKTSTPIIQLPHSSQEDSKRKIETQNEIKTKFENSTTILRNKEKVNEDCGREASVAKACTPVQRQSKVIVPTPQVGCCQILRNDQSAISQFSFPTSSRPIAKNMTFVERQTTDFGLTTNQQLPPSKSLTSPFPMQFRERQKPPYITTTSHEAVNMAEAMNNDPEGFRDRSICGQNEIEVVAGTLSVITSSISSQENTTRMLKTAQKGELPPPCPLSKTRREMASCSQPQERNSRHRSQQSSNRMLRQSARAVSVMDLDDEEEEFSDDYVGEQRIDPLR